MENALFQQAYRFAITGGGATVIHVCSALFLHEFLQVPAINANFIAFILSWGFSYMGNFHWTFEKTEGHSKTLLPFMLLSLFGLLINQSIVIVTDLYFGWDLWIALIIVVITVPTFTFLVSKHFIFSNQTS